MKDGGPAFPIEYRNLRDATREIEFGISIRDYFAAKALNSDRCPFNSYEHTQAAEWAYEQADAMLATRSK